jgi:hypothetical protein
MDWTDKLAELILQGLPGAARLLPDHVQRRFKARLHDLNPLARISANEDLTRTLRLAWIEAALDVDTRVRALAQHGEWRAAAESVERFSVLLRGELIALRQDAFRRDEPLRPSPIDTALQSVLTDLPRYVVDRQRERGATLDDAFAPTLAAAVRWPVDQVPSIYAQVATTGDGQAQRRFGELVFAAFAEIVKHPGESPEASTAFNLAQQAMAREVALQTLSTARGLDESFDRLLGRLEGAPYRSMDQFASWVDDATVRLGRLEDKVDALLAQDERMLSRLAGVVAGADLSAGFTALIRQARLHSTDVVPADPFRRVLRLYDEDPLPDAALPLAFERYARAYCVLQRSVGGRAAQARYSVEARRALETLLQAGNLEAADDLLATEHARHDQQARTAAHERAAVMADRARVAFLRNDLVAMCLFLREASDTVRFDRALAWGHTLQVYVNLCRDWRVLEELKMASPLDDEVAHGEVPLDDATISDALWGERSALAQAIDARVARVIADHADYKDFRVWSLQIEEVARGLLDLADRTRDALEARAALAGFELFGTSFYTSDDPIDIQLNLDNVHAAKALYDRLSGPPPA